MTDQRRFAFPDGQALWVVDVPLALMDWKTVIGMDAEHQTCFSHLVRRHFFPLAPVECRKEAPAGVTDHGSCQELNSEAPWGLWEVCHCGARWANHRVVEKAG